MKGRPSLYRRTQALTARQQRLVDDAFFDCLIAHDPHGDEIRAEGERQRSLFRRAEARTAFEQRRVLAADLGVTLVEFDEVIAESRAWVESMMPICLP